jgi:hypothetical protein
MNCPKCNLEMKDMGEWPMMFDRSFPSTLPMGHRYICRCNTNVYIEILNKIVRKRKVQGEEFPIYDIVEEPTA